MSMSESKQLPENTSQQTRLDASDSEDENAKLDERTFEIEKRPEDAAAQQEQEDAQSELLADYPDDTEEIELTHSRIRSLKGLQLERFGSHLKKLCLRQNLINSLLLENDVAPLESLDRLEELDLYDNKIHHIEGIKGLSSLKTLDFSFNLIKHLPPAVFETLTSLKTLYVIQNKISHIKGLDALAPTLTSLELGGNRLREIENVGMLVNLTELWLGKNKITKLQGLENLVNLKILSISSNRITVIEGLDTLTQLEEFYISHNGLKTISGLDKLAKLRVLDICANQIEEIVNISHLTELEEFWANDNKLRSIADVERELKPLSKLETVYLEGNPLQKELGTTYRRKLIDMLPQVSQIDATFVKQV